MRLKLRHLIPDNLPIPELGKPGILFLLSSRITYIKSVHSDPCMSQVLCPGGGGGAAWLRTRLLMMLRAADNNLDYRILHAKCFFYGNYGPIWP